MFNRAKSSNTSVIQRRIVGMPFFANLTRRVTTLFVCCAFVMSFVPGCSGVAGTEPPASAIAQKLAISATSLAATTTVQSRRQRGVTLFEGVFLGFGAASALLPEIWTPELEARLGYSKFTRKESNRFALIRARMERVMEVAHPSIFEEFYSGMTSGDPVNVDQAVVSIQSTLASLANSGPCTLNNRSGKTSTNSSCPPCPQEGVPYAECTAYKLLNMTVVVHPPIYDLQGVFNSDYNIDIETQTALDFNQIFDFDLVADFVLEVVVAVVFALFIPLPLSDPAAATAPIETNTYSHDELIAILTSACRGYDR